ncbi:MAG: MBOAT family protein [Desulfobacteraceae bacterium]|nr:MBOAT family protein [Desulfobacteraceae bacterium]
MLFSTTVDYILGLAITRYRRYARLWVAASVAVNLGLLVYFKYADFLLTGLNPVLSFLGLNHILWSNTVLPIGISFFTFQKLSYILDIYRRHAKSANNFIDFSLYVSMFPQLIAGPIVRFKDICNQLNHRSNSWEEFHSGILRLCWGLSKKVLLADACGQIADAVFALDPAMLDTKTAWLGALAYTFQIYFDFSAYSDMAIGLARMFGFELPENFKRPYSAVCLTDFWRRWHISLGAWFRDYVYFPLGGNKKKPLRTYANLFIVFCLCGLWHGANWTFLAWGLYHGFFLMIERITDLRNLLRVKYSWISRMITFLIVVFGWVLFRADSLTDAAAFIKVMIIPGHLPMPYELYKAMHPRNLTFFLLGCIFVTGAGLLPTGEQIIRTHGRRKQAFSAIMIFIVLPYCAAFVLQGTDQPFIYFRF